MPESNNTIVENLRKGDENTFYHLYLQYYGLLLTFAKNTIRNPLLAEDIVQDAFCALWENRARLKNDLPVQGYLFKLVHCRCVDLLRSQMSQSKYQQHTEIMLRELDLYQPDNPIISGILTGEAQSIIHETINSLPRQTQDVFILSRNHHLKNAEIAEKKGISVKTVEYHIARALEQLRRSLKDFLK